MNNTKKLILPAFLLMLVVSCTSSDDPKPASCQPTVIEDFDRSSSFFYFTEGSDGFNVLESISIYDGTDSAYMYTYEYSGNKISKLTSEINSTVNYTPTYDGDKLTTLSGRPVGVGITTEEIRLTYSGNDVSTVAYYVADPNSGTLYQYLNYSFKYNDGNLTVAEYYLDLNMIFTLAFGGTPTQPYAPEFVFANEYGYGSQEAPNGLFGQINLFKPEMSMMKNVPTTITQKDVDGNLIGSLGYELTFNDQGFPTLADASNSFIDYSYNCN